MEERVDEDESGAGLARESGLVGSLPLPRSDGDGNDNLLGVASGTFAKSARGASGCLIAI